MNYKMKPKCIDLFCGAGGLTYGLRKSGVDVVAGIDLDPACEYSYRTNNAGTVFWPKDIEKVTREDIEGLFEGAEVRVLAGCAPCQPFSTYSQRYDQSRDGKWALLSKFGDLVAKVEPEIVTMENVPSILTHRVLQDFISTLREKEYEVWCEPVDCSQYGVPQTRMRTVLLASKLGEIELIDPSTKTPKTVRQAIGKMPPLEAGEGSAKDRLHVSSSLSPMNLKRIRASKPGGTWKDWPKRLVAPCHRSETGRTYPSVYGRMEWDKPAPTMTTQCFGYGNGRFGHPVQDRAISLREAAILQGFPRSYKFVPPGEPVAFKTIGRLIGNAVPVGLGKAIGKSIVKHLDQHGYA